MSEHERRRYFRINETVGLSIQVLGDSKSKPANATLLTTNAELIAKNDSQIEHLLNELSEHHPQVAELGALLNQKLERVSSMLSIDNQLLDRIAHRVQEVNISACGLAFSHDELIPEGTRLLIELTLYPNQSTLRSEAVVVACEPTDDTENFYCRINFLAMAAADQEELIQFVVQSQGSQLKDRQTF